MNSAYQTLETLQAEGKIKGIGVSNYAWEDYLELKPNIKELPVVNQIEINPFLYRKNTIAKFQQEGVVLQSYRSLRNGSAMDHPTLVEIAKVHGKTTAQILGRWCVQKGFVYVPKSVQRSRMEENAQVFDFELSETEMATQRVAMLQLEQQQQIPETPRQASLNDLLDRENHVVTSIPHSKKPRNTNRLSRVATPSAALAQPRLESDPTAAASLCFHLSNCVRPPRAVYSFLATPNSDFYRRKCA